MKMALKRICAFLLDCIIVFFVLTIVNGIIPTYVNVEQINDSTLEITNKYINQEITESKFNEEISELSYQLSKGTFLYTISGIVIYILYFVVFQSYNNGQTFGKKLFKLQVLKYNGELPNVNSLLIRSLIPYGILVNFILLVLILFVSKDIYFIFNTILTNVHTIIIIISIFLMFIRGKGIQDYLAKTKVEEI